MANELCASGFGGALDGQYNLMYTDHWSNGTYWLYKDSYFWMISDSEFLYDISHTVAIRRCIDQDTHIPMWVNGEYYTPEILASDIGYFLPDPLPPSIGTITLGTC